MKKFKFSIYLFAITFIFSSCEKEPFDTTNNDSIDSIENQQELRFGSVSMEEIPDIISDIEKSMFKSSLNGKGLRTDNFIVDLNTIKFIKSKIKRGRTNYSFPIFVDGQGDHEFYNLIVSVNPNGKIVNQRIRRYVVADHALERYRSSNYDMAYFQGSYDTYKVDEFQNSISFKNGELSLKSSDCNNDGNTIGSASSSPGVNPDLIQTDQHQNWGPESGIPDGTVSFTSYSESYVAYTAGAYQNYGNSSSEYEETVSTSSEGIVWLGNNSPSGPSVVGYQYNSHSTSTHGPSTSFNSTANHAPEGNAFTLGPDICTTHVIIKVTYSDGTSTMIDYYSGCEATGPINKSETVSNLKSGCDDEPMEVITINLMALVSVRNKLCLDNDSEGYKHLVSSEGQADLADLNNFLITNGVQDGCIDNSRERNWALMAVAALPTEKKVSFEDHVHLLDETNQPCIKDILDKLQNSDIQRLTIPDIGGLDGTSHIAKSIIDMFDDSNDYDLIFEVAEAGLNGNGDPRRAKTLKSGDNIKVTLDDDYVRNATKLSIARTIIHESIHAFMAYAMNRYRNSDLTTEVQAYMQYLVTSGKPYQMAEVANMTTHEFMSQYVDAIAHSLSVWDDAKQPMNYYKKLSWAGLETSNAYQSQTNKTQIQNAINNEANSTSGARGDECN